MTIVGIEESKTVVCGDPQLTLTVTLDGGDTIVGETVGGREGTCLVCLQVIAEKSRIGAIPQETVILADHSDGFTVVETIAGHGATIGSRRSKHLCPTAAGNIQTTDTHCRGGIDTLAIGRHMDLRDEIVSDTVHRTVCVGPLGHHVSTYLLIRTQTEHAMTHRSQPETSLSVGFNIHDNEMVILRIVQGMILQTGRINPSSTLAIGSHPDASVGTFFNVHDSRRDACQQVLLEPVAGIEDVDAILISTHPRPVTAVDQHADDTSRTDGITPVTELIAHITEALGGDGLAIESLLEQAEPEVAVAVLSDGIHLALGQVYLKAEEGIVDHTVLPGIIDGDTLAVVAYDDTVVTVAEKG